MWASIFQWNAGPNTNISKDTVHISVSHAELQGNACKNGAQ